MKMALLPHPKADVRREFLRKKRPLGRLPSGWDDYVQTDAVSLTQKRNWKAVAQNRIGGGNFRRP